MQILSANDIYTDDALSEFLTFDFSWEKSHDKLTFFDRE